MIDDSELKMNTKRKYKAESLPENLKSPRLKDFTQSVSVLCLRLQKCDREVEALSSKRVINTLTRGLGSSNTQVQKNYFATLVALLKDSEMSPNSTARNILDAMESELHVTRNLTKGEESEILMGRVLTFGTLVRSETLTTAKVDDQVAAVSQLLQDVKKKSYLPLAADPFLIDYLKQVKESTFKKAMWPILQQEVRPGPEQTLLMYHVLLVCEERFPSVVSTKFLKQTLNSSQVLSTITMPGLLLAVKEYRLETIVNHSAFADIFKFLIKAPEEILQSFWQQVETQLMADVTEVSNKNIMALGLFNLLVMHLENASQMAKLITPKLLFLVVKNPKVPARFNAIFSQSCKEMLQNLCKLCTKPNSSKAVLSVIKKLLFNSGHICCKQTPGVKVVQQLIGQLNDKAVMNLAVTLKDGITGSSSVIHFKGSESIKRPWHNKEKLYTVHLFCRLLTHSSVHTNTEWILKQLAFLFDMGFFTTSNIGVELACHVRESFFSCLNLKLPNLLVLRNILGGIVEHINNRLDKGDLLRIKVTSEVLPAWKKMLKTARQIGEDEKYKKEEWVISVFQTMFYHIGLHLFKEATFAIDVLQELHSVYERIGVTTSSEEEPHWTEVVVEMFLSLLSRNSQLHRHLIGCIFSHFCPIMKPQNIHQILQILDPSSDTNPLLNNLDPDSENSAEEDESDGSGEEDDNKESSDDGMTDFEEDEEEEKVNDKLRRAIIEALGDTGAVTDVESVDLDNMDEEEGARVDKALSEAFKALKPLKNKKQPLHAKALTHFRLRVLDLIEVWLASEPPLDLLVDTLLRLISLLEHSLADRYQAPLETRVRSVIKKLTAVKKYDVSDCKSLPLGNILKSLLEKGDRTTTVYMSVSKELTKSTLFIVKASQQIDEINSAEDSTNVTVLSVLKDSVKSFFLQRDCLLTVGLFEGLFELNVPLVLTLLPKLPHYVFDHNVHPFRRSKALEFLMIFWKKNRILQDSADDHLELMTKVSNRLYKGFKKMLEEPFARVKSNFVALLRKALSFIHTKNWLPEVDWPDLLQCLTEFQKTHCVKSYARKWTIFTSPIGHGNDHVEDMEDNDNVEDMEGNDHVEDMEGNDHVEDIEGNDHVEDMEGNDHVEDMEVELSDEQKQDVSQSESEKELVEASKEKEGLNSEEDKVEDEVLEGKIDENEEPLSEPEEEPPRKKLKKKSDKKKNHEKIKRTQLLKNNSKKMRLEAMAVGLDENISSKYKMLMNNTSPPSPDQ